MVRCYIRNSIFLSPDRYPSWDHFQLSSSFPPPDTGNLCDRFETTSSSNAAPNGHHPWDRSRWQLSSFPSPDRGNVCGRFETRSSSNSAPDGCQQLDHSHLSSRMFL